MIFMRTAWLFIIVLYFQENVNIFVEKTGFVIDLRRYEIPKSEEDSEPRTRLWRVHQAAPKK